MIKNVILSTLTIAVLAGCSGKQASEKDTDAVEPIPVKVQKLEKQDIARTLDYTLTCKPTNRFITPRHLPTDRKNLVEVGAQVKKDNYW